MELAAIVDALDDVLAAGNRRTTPSPPMAMPPFYPSIDSRQYSIRFDGSFIKGKGAGIGITLSYRNSTGLIASFSVPTKTYDAQRTEILGPTLASLLVACFGGSLFFVEGDSAYVIGLLNR